MENVLKLQDISRRFGKQTVLEHVELELGQGKVVGLLGSGKTTLLKLCAGLISPNGGSITVCGEAVGKKTKAFVSYLPDILYLNPRWRVRKHLRWFRDFFKDFDRETAQRLLSELDIPVKKRFGKLSRRDRQTVQLVLAMSRRAKLYLLDEPLASLDPVARLQLLDTLLKNRDPESTVLIATGLIEETEPLLEEYLLLDQGRILHAETVEALRENGDATGVFREVFACS